MHIQSLHIRNYRRLRDVRIDLEPEISIFVGANNSGKTSATHLLGQFLGKSSDREGFTIYDFHAPSWATFNQLGEEALENSDKISCALPCIELDIWINVENADLHRVIDLLPSLDWSNDSAVGVRLQWAPKNTDQLLNDFVDAYQEAKKRAGHPQEEKPSAYHPWPKNLCDYLKKHLNELYTIHYYVLDSSQRDSSHPNDPPLLLDGTGAKCREVLDNLIRVDIMSAQRHLTDKDSSHSSVRSENLSKHFSRSYRRHSKQHEVSHDVMRALSESEQQMNTLFDKVFDSTFRALETMGMGHPNLSAPSLEVRSSMKPERVLADHTEVYYILPKVGSSNNSEMALPDRYNGLGFKNMIYMTLEILDCQKQWLDEPNPSPIHLIIIEEPEAHLHIQLQQVFIRQVFKIIKQEEPVGTNQVIVTTRSPHIIYEKGFPPIRYFRRQEGENLSHSSQVLNLSYFKNSHSDEEVNHFLLQYMKLTHCDLFFSDAAVLVEGNVERLLLPLMIEKAAPGLQSRYLSILEVGGAFAYRFQKLIEFLGITTLIITDLDSIHPHKKMEHERIEGEEEEETNAGGTSCPANTPNAVTSNQTLIQWLPKKQSIQDLLSANESDKIQNSPKCQALVRVAYQTNRYIKWKNSKGEDQTDLLVGRTLEETFALENWTWCQESSHSQLNLKTKEHLLNSTSDLTEALFKRIQSGSFKKTAFALNLIMENDREGWNVPYYIEEGLKWLENTLNKIENDQSSTQAELAVSEQAL